MDKRFYWLQDRVEQGEFRVFWATENHNLVDYFTKYHSPATHKQLRPIHPYIKDKSPSSLQGCIELLTSTDRPSARPHSNNQTTKPGNKTITTSQPTTYQLLDKLTNTLRDRLLFSNL